MGARRLNGVLLFSATGALLLGFINEIWCGIGASFGLIPALLWIVNDLRKKTLGSDVLAVLSLTATLLTNEYFAGAVIALMLASGRVLESWAEGQAERQLKSLLARIPQNARRFLASRVLEEIKVN